MARFSLRTAELALLSTPRPWIIRHPVVERKARSCCPNIASTEDHRNSLPPIIQIIGVNALQPSPATDFSSSLSWKTFRSSLSPVLFLSFFFFFFFLPLRLSLRETSAEGSIRDGGLLGTRWRIVDTESRPFEEIRKEWKVQSLTSFFLLPIFSHSLNTIGWTRLVLYLDGRSYFFFTTRCEKRKLDKNICKC